MLLREVLSDTHQPSFVEAADQQEHCSLSLKIGRAEVLGKTSILNGVIRWNKFRQIFISYHLATGECPFNCRSDERLPAAPIHCHRGIHIRLMRSADVHLISSCNRRIPVQLLLRRTASGFQFITVESFISGL